MLSENASDGSRGSIETLSNTQQYMLIDARQWINQYTNVSLLTLYVIQFFNKCVNK